MLSLCGALVQAVKVNSLGKWKTALQMVALSALLLLHKAHNVLGREEHVVEALHWAARASLFVLWAGAFLAVRSCFSPHIAPDATTCHIHAEVTLYMACTAGERVMPTFRGT